MERLHEILKNVCPSVDFENCTDLVSGKRIDSMDLVSIISDIEDEFGISIEMDRITPENFDSMEAIWKTVSDLL
ncbi:MAG: acyl carrier protein [Lachnospiraceae bacterium]|nr:acyl carrier protein [Lachnospiraceae bacterium]